MRRIYILLTIITVFSLSQKTLAQVYMLENNSSVNQNAAASQIPDEKIAQLVQQMKEKNMTIDDVLELARIKGATETQVQELRQRTIAYQQQKQKEENRSTTKDMLKNNPKIDTTLFSQRDFASDTLKNTKNIFGFNFFNTKNLNFASNINTPLSDDYLVGVGDEIQISVYGASQRDYSLQVQKDNAVNIPNIGPVYVGGHSLGEVKKMLKNRLSAIYNGMQGRNPNTFATISVGNLPGINVNIIGEANKPGTYTLPATATVFNALYLAAGPAENGSFRSIDIIRDGKVVANTDVYSFLIDGDTRGNIQLRNNDVIRINPYIERIVMEGAFKRTGLFEAKPGETLADVIRFAGGFTSDSYKEQVGITRNNSRTLSFKTVSASEYEIFQMMSGDKIKAGQVVTRFENRVSIEGAVYRPGDYELMEGMTLTDLIKQADGLTDDAFLDRGILTRRSSDMKLQTLSFSIKDVLNGNENIVLKREDNVLISSKFNLEEEKTISILGAVQTPNKYPYSEGMTVSDLIFMAGGFKENASVVNIEIARRLSYDEAEILSNNLIHTYTISVSRDLQIAEKDKQMLLEPFDYVYVRTAPGLSNGQGTVSINGEIKYSGNYGIMTKSERLSDLINRAGGISPDAYLEGSSLRRKYILSDAEYQAKVDMAKQDSTISDSEVIKIEKEVYKVVSIKLNKALDNKGSAYDLLLENGDQLFIPKKLQTIKVSGAVLNPVAITYNKSFSTRDYINLSGGFAQNAKKGKVYVLYPNGEAHATKGFIIKSYPKVVSGSEIIVPEKPEIDKTGQAQKWIGMGSGIAGIAASIAAIISITK